MQELIEESEVVHHRHRMLLVRIIKLEQPLILNARHFLDRQLPQEEDTVKDYLHRIANEHEILAAKAVNDCAATSIRCLLMQ
jgi:hypothetical protein